jgi:broad specificity phosphatase PhoE
VSRPPCVWLVRHGESDWNVLGWVQGQSLGPTLTPKGRLQAQSTAEQLAVVPLRSIYSSDLARANETAAIIGACSGLPLVTSRALRERNLGEAEGGPPGLLGSASGIVDGRVVDADSAPVGGESIRELYTRAVDFVLSLPDPDGSIFVTHGGVIRVLLAWSEGRGPDGMSWPLVANGSVFSCQLHLGSVSDRLVDRHRTHLLSGDAT